MAPTAAHVIAIELTGVAMTTAACSVLPSKSWPVAMIVIELM
jgi:hypothetical protein